MGCYGDSSFLVSCYIADRHTAQAQAVLARIGGPLPFTALHELEVTNAFQLGIFRGHITADEAMAARGDLAADLREGRLTRTVVKWPSVWRSAVRLSERHSMVVGSRSLDIAHVAAAVALRAGEFVSFDVRQCELARAAGLRVVA